MILPSSIFCTINGDRKSQELHLSTCVQLCMTKHPSRKVINFRHSLGCDTIERSQKTPSFGVILLSVSDKISKTF